MTGLLPILAWAYLASGDLERAQETARQAVRRGREQQHRIALVDALRVQAMVALRHGRWTEAEHALEEGHMLARTMPYPYAEARLLQVDGELRRQKGDSVAAREHLEAARTIFQRLGARKDVERVEQDLAPVKRTFPG